MKEVMNLWRKSKKLKFWIGILSSQFILIIFCMLLIAITAEQVTQQTIQVALLIQDQTETDETEEQGSIAPPPSTIGGSDLVLPILQPARITCNFTCYANHGGTDFSAFYGATVQSVMSGMVTKVVSGFSSNGGYLGHPGGYGNYVTVQHSNGVVTRYAHLQNNILVREGMAVGVGQPLGFQGNSGNSSGSHLHFEWIENRIRINPERRLPL